MRETQDTAAWRFQVWASFVVATAATAVGVAYLPVDAWTRGYLAMGLLFTVGSAFNLAKTVRDEHEAKRLVSKLEDATANRLLRDMESDEITAFNRKAA